MVTKRDMVMVYDKVNSPVISHDNREITWQIKS